MRRFGATAVRRILQVLGLVGTLVVTLLGGAPLAHTAPENAAYVAEAVEVSKSVTRVSVYSPSMDRVITSDVIHPVGGGPAPTFYLLTGIGGGEDGISWFNNTSITEFFADKHVNVVLPVGGKFSMYTDWVADDPVLGRNKWQTFLTRELPPVIDRQFQTTGVNAIGGVSMGAGPVLDLAIQAPDVYRAVGSYSGCARTSDANGQAMVRSMVELRGGGNAANMWGPIGGPLWVQHDPFVQAEKLRGKALFLSAASGMPGEIDNHNPLLTIPQAIGGGVVEAITQGCTAVMDARLRSLGIPATVVYRDEGSHSWGLFEAEMRDSWPVIGPAIGA
ncbi:alpha/beta hydrolase [Rhodococcus xishaensis]|uniref:Esterase family protein n=1 Tax=Rhodococcus xishaensis TaxID=2487364 RepID=A0A3S3ACG0_9NOCA|nr:alpha/beta hydrolase family protein [Rhodococcus xishaensis]RVW01265.1 esterase family protein [Rhodococcus xishaensis]